MAAAPHPRSGPNPWLVTLLVALVLGGVLYGVYSFAHSSNGSKAATATPGEGTKAEATGPQTHPYLKYLELAGIRIIEEGNKAKLRFVVVNHSAADMTALELKGVLTTNEAKENDPPVGTFVAKVGSVGPYESKDVNAIVDTKMKPYELPDWQFLKVKFEITSPH